MGTIVEISRAKIIEAIRKEPVTTLHGGAWWEMPVYVNTSMTQVRNKNCHVCAVGAVMRNAVLHPFQNAESISDAAEASTEVGDACGDPDAEVRQKNWMSALSSFFELTYWTAHSRMESAVDKIQSKENRILSDKECKKMEHDMVEAVRKATIEFVKENFPTKIQIDIDGARPALDVKVIGQTADNCYE